MQKLLMAAVVAAASFAWGGAGARGVAAEGGYKRTAPARSVGQGVLRAALAPPQDGPDALYFRPTAALAAPGALDTLYGGTALFDVWDPNDTNRALQPGMKIMMFGLAQGCTLGTQGPLTTVADSRLSEVARLTSLPSVAANADLRWTPSGNVDGCDAVARGRTGASTVYLNASDADGAVGMLTTTGPQSDGKAAFLGPYDKNGQNGAGGNAYIAGTFVNFRQPWWVADPLQPWVGLASARIRSVQSMGAYRIDTDAGVTVQSKQQMMATFLNPTCVRTMTDQPCQVQYLFNTAIVRSGVTDWHTVPWFQNGTVWFDPVQGGIPIVDGPIFASGKTTKDGNSGLPLYASIGAQSQHQVFTDKAFDVTISFAQLKNVLRIVTARKLGVDQSAVIEEQIANVWGSAWNDRNNWVLLSADVGQEVYNPTATHTVQIGGGFRSLYVGPQ